MIFFDFIDKISKSTKELDKKATNPFINSKFEYNPFVNAFKQTYVWIEEDNDTKVNNSS